MTVRKLNDEWELHTYDCCEWDSQVTNNNNVCAEICEHCVEFEHIVETDNGRGGSYHDSKYFRIPIEILKAIMEDHEKRYGKEKSTRGD